MAARAERIPRDFVRAFMARRGYQNLELLRCDPCHLEEYRGLGEPHAGAFAHPIKFLWDHARRGHPVEFMVCHYWTWETGGGRNREGEMVEMMGTKDSGYEWDKKLGKFRRTYVLEDRDCL